MKAMKIKLLGKATPEFGKENSQMIQGSEFEHLLEAFSIPRKGHNDTHFVDFLGVKTRIDLLPWASARLSELNLEIGTGTRLPIPDDGYRSGAEEYVGIAVSLMNADENYTVVELGAGWAPWVVSGVTIAKRLGKNARGAAVEANPKRCNWAVQHAADNDLSVRLIAPSLTNFKEPWNESLAQQEVSVIQAAIWDTDSVLLFPILADNDMGGRPTDVNLERAEDHDYRGALLGHEQARAISLSSILDEFGAIDLLHVDVQGHELEILLPSLSALEEKVKFLAVGTHSRYIEGILQTQLLVRGWGLLIDVPSVSDFQGKRPTLEAFTLKDGYQYWISPRSTLLN